MEALLVEPKSRRVIFGGRNFVFRKGGEGTKSFSRGEKRRQAFSLAPKKGSEPLEGGESAEAVMFEKGGEVKECLSERKKGGDISELNGGKLHATEKEGAPQNSALRRKGKEGN